MDEVYYVDGIAYCAGLPVHLSIDVNKNGDGPVDRDSPDYYETICWCGQYECRRWPL